MTYKQRGACQTFLLFSDVIRNGTMKRNVTLIVIGIVIINSCCAANLSRIFRPKRAVAEQDFILRSCIASAQLTRKHRTNDASPRGQLLQQLQQQQQSVPVQLASNRAKSSKEWGDGDVSEHPLLEPRQRSRSKGRYLTDKIVTDSPLGTLDVKAAREDMPKVFKKREPLPLLNRQDSARQLDIDAPIVVVKP